MLPFYLRKSFFFLWLCYIIRLIFCEIPNAARHRLILAALGFRLCPAGHRRCHPELVELLRLASKARGVAEWDLGGTSLRMTQKIHKNQPFAVTEPYFLWCFFFFLTEKPKSPIFAPRAKYSPWANAASPARSRWSFPALSMSVSSTSTATTSARNIS